jgi:cathepsin B
MGTIVDPEWTIAYNTTTYEEPADISENLPTNFDARVNFSHCKATIDNVRDQSNCGSCWAFGTTEAFNDRGCIAGFMTSNWIASTADTTGCCDGLNCFSFGCNGGQVGTPWTWFTKTGVVSGDGYGSNRMDCYDYTMPMCNHHQPKSTLPECDAVKQVAPTCPAKTDNLCPNDKALSYTNDKKKAVSSYGFGKVNTVANVKNDLHSYGSVTGAFTVYEDFLTYKSGVYQH